MPWEKKYSDEFLLEELERVAECIGETPTQEQFDDIGVCASRTVAVRFGGWNKAKEEAGLGQYAYYPGGEKGNPETTKKGLYRKVKDNSECENCGEDENCCLVFHHLDEDKKEFEISRFVNLPVSREELREEIEKCVVLCSNCHRMVHSDSCSLSADDIS